MLSSSKHCVKLCTELSFTTMHSYLQQMMSMAIENILNSKYLRICFTTRLENALPTIRVKIWKWILVYLKVTSGKYENKSGQIRTILRLKFIKILLWVTFI